jgi:Holliday junction resolvase RusA-like endonuclease
MTAQGVQRVCLTIAGEPASKANSRKLVMIQGRPAFIKSDKARAWLASADKQVKTMHPLMAGPLVFYCRIFYATERPDLDPSLIEDFLQGRIYQNDRQLREKHLYHGIDRANPRVEIVLEPMQPCLL